MVDISRVLDVLLAVGSVDVLVGVKLLLQLFGLVGDFLLVHLVVLGTG